ncbi:MAG: YqaJ viral recombinase family protein [Candidatus Phlomobacter fragariae]
MSLMSLSPKTGFVPHPTIEGFGASPDGLVNDDGLIEIKCPNTTTHIETIITGKPKYEYLLQMHGQMMCTGRNWCDLSAMMTDSHLILPTIKSGLSRMTNWLTKLNRPFKHLLTNSNQKLTALINMWRLHGKPEPV